MTLVLDSGALIALDRNDRSMWRRFKAANLRGEVPVSHGGIVGQVWRSGGPRHALLAMALAATDVRALDHAAGRAAGELLARARKNDVVDAAVVLLANDGDVIITSDVRDLQPLAAATGHHVELLRA